MGMCREPMLVFRMVVIGVRVHVQRNARAGGRSHNQSEQDRHKAVHDFESMGALERRQTTCAMYEAFAGDERGDRAVDFGLTAT